MSASYRTLLRETSLGAKILVGSAGVALVLVMGFVPFWQSLKSADRLNRADDRGERARALTAVALGHVVDLQTGTRGFIITGDERFLEPQRRARRTLPRELDKLRQLVRDQPATASMVRSSAREARSYLRFNARHVAVAREQRARAAAAVASGEGKRRVDRLRAQFAEISRRVEAQVKRLRADQLDAERRALALALAGLVLALVVIGLLTRYLRRSIAAPVGRLNEGARQLAAGDLSARVEVGGASEFATLAASFNEMAASLQSSRQNLESANRELEEARGEADRANAAKSEFLSRMSHELRTPLNSVLGFAQLLQMDGLEGEQRQSLDHIIRSADHLLELINEVLDISRIEAGQMSISREPVALRQAVDEAVAMMRPAATERDIDIVMRDEAAWESHVLADQQRLRQVLLNLLSNAVKYNRSGGSIGLCCAPGPAGSVRLAVSDTGAGLGAEQRERLFEAFDRLGAEQSEVEGTGLGLALSKRLIELMGGTLWAESEPGEGTTFWVELQAAADPLSETGAAGQQRSRSSNGRSASVTVLYIEDNTANFRLVERALARLGAVELLAAMHAGLGLELAAQHQPQLILLDLHLPDLPGEQVLARLKADPVTRHIPVVILSADATERQIERMLASGAEAYLTKPLDLPIFFETVEDLIGERVAT